MTAIWVRGVIRTRGDGQATRMVLKFGGSLLGRPCWPGELRALLAVMPDHVTVVVGGGALVDGLRAIDAAGSLPADVMDRLAVDAMGITAALVAEAISLPLAIEPMGDGAVVLDAPAWLARHRRSHELPIGWGVTSDSIAAAVAAASGACLLLAKSVPPPTGSLAELSRAGWVDDHFPIASAALAEIGWTAPETVTPTSSR